MAEEPKQIIEKAVEEAPAVVEKGAGEDIMTLLQEIADRVSALENPGGEAEKAEPEPEEEDGMEEKSVDVAEAVAKSLESKLDKMLDKALAKRLDAKEPETPRPALNKNDLQKSEVEQLLADGSKVAGMGYRAITGKLDKTDTEVRPW